LNKENIFVKIDTVFIFKVTKERLINIEDEYYIYKRLKEEENLQEAKYKILFEGETDLDKMEVYDFSDNFKRLIINNHINNIYIMDFAMYINSIEDEDILEEIKLYENIENLYKEFIIYLNNFRKEQILKWTFNIKQRRISRKKLKEIKEDMKKTIKVNLSYEDIF